MKYSEYLEENEQEAKKLGERNIITIDKLNYFLGNEKPYGDTIELLLDIVNDIYSIEDFLKELNEACAEMIPHCTNCDYINDTDEACWNCGGTEVQERGIENETKVITTR